MDNGHRHPLLRTHPLTNMGYRENRRTESNSLDRDAENRGQVGEEERVGVIHAHLDHRYHCHCCHLCKATMRLLGTTTLPPLALFSSILILDMSYGLFYLCIL